MGVVASCGIAAAQSSCRRCCPLRPLESLTPPLVAHVTVLVPDDPQEVEAEGQQGGAQQVPQCRQVWDGEAVGVFAAPPHGVDHPVGNAQQQQHLEEEEEDGEVEIKFEVGNPEDTLAAFLDWQAAEPF